ncbi:MAG: nitroreductase [Defluviitaleaceae bacterium]|nr:nitroreductase [Defluviitaleaceae bacterium]MCL2835814.1 nitroreductase [Defluviitaleaceae bacterium]
MLMAEIIRKRKSIRKYDPAALDSATLEKVRAQIENVKPLYPDIRYSIEITNKTKGLFNIKAPHYLIFGSEEKEGAYENIGFVGQQLDLFLSAAGLGACWLGASKPQEIEASVLPHVISLAFGKPGEPLHRDLSEFKRKPLSDISQGSDKRLEAARLAPSGVNAQNWYFIADNNKILCYRKKSNPLLGFFYNKLGCIDMGIALCHIAEESENFNYIKEANVPGRKGCVYMGTVI